MRPFAWSPLSEGEKSLILQLPGPILVTGVGGFVGTALFGRLTELRTDVYGVCSPKNESWRLKLISHAKLLRIDLCHQGTELNRSWEKILPQTVFHCAGYGGRHFEDEFTKMLESNVVGLQNILECAKRFSTQAVVLAGSSSEYGFNSDSPSEEALRAPDSLYSVAKNAATLLAQYYHQAQRLPLVVLRLYSVYGPFESFDRLIPRLLLVSQQDGCFPPLVRPNDGRDFIFIDDVLQGFVRAALAIQQVQGLVLNLGTGSMTTLASLVEKVRKMRGEDLLEAEFMTYPARSWDRTRWLANTNKLQEKLGWSPQVSIDEGLLLTDQWLMTHGHYSLVKDQKQLRTVSLVVACYHDEQAIHPLFQRVTKVFENLHNYDFEILFVDDGSPHGDGEQIKALQKVSSKVKGIHHTRNFGSQAAFRSGMMAAKGELICLMDGDLQDPPEEIPRFLEKMEQGYDVVYGIRRRREMGYLQDKMTSLFYWLLSRFSEHPIPEKVGDFAIMKRAVVMALLTLPERNFFWRTQRAWVGFKQIGVCYYRPARPFGQSTNSWWRLFGWAKYAFFLNSWAPLKLIWLFWVMAMIGFIAASLHALVRDQFLPLLIAGGAVGVLGALVIIGEYLKLVLIEVRARPHAIVLDSEEIKLTKPVSRQADASP